MGGVDNNADTEHDVGGTSGTNNKPDTELNTNGLGGVNDTTNMEYNASDTIGANNKTDVKLDASKLGWTNNNADMDYNAGDTQVEPITNRIESLMWVGCISQ